MASPRPISSPERKSYPPRKVQSTCGSQLPTTRSPASSSGRQDLSSPAKFLRMPDCIEIPNTRLPNNNTGKSIRKRREIPTEPGERKRSGHFAIKKTTSSKKADRGHRPRKDMEQPLSPIKAPDPEVPNDWEDQLSEHLLMPNDLERPQAWLPPLLDGEEDGDTSVHKSSNPQINMRAPESIDQMFKHILHCLVLRQGDVGVVDPSKDLPAFGEDHGFEPLKDINSNKQDEVLHTVRGKMFLSRIPLGDDNDSDDDEDESKAMDKRVSEFNTSSPEEPASTRGGEDFGVKDAEENRGTVGDENRGCATGSATDVKGCDQNNSNGLPCNGKKTEQDARGNSSVEKTESVESEFDAKIEEKFEQIDLRSARVEDKGIESCDIKRVDLAIDVPKMREEEDGHMVVSNHGILGGNSLPEDSVPSTSTSLFTRARKIGRVMFNKMRDRSPTPDGIRDSLNNAIHTGKAFVQKSKQALVTSGICFFETDDSESEPKRPNSCAKEARLAPYSVLERDVSLGEDTLCELSREDAPCSVADTVAKIEASLIRNSMPREDVDKRGHVNNNPVTYAHEYSTQNKNMDEKGIGLKASPLLSGRTYEAGEATVYDSVSAHWNEATMEVMSSDDEKERERRRYFENYSAQLVDGALEVLGADTPDIGFPFEPVTWAQTNDAPSHCRGLGCGTGDLREIPEHHQLSSDEFILVAGQTFPSCLPALAEENSLESLVSTLSLDAASVSEDVPRKTHSLVIQDADAQDRDITEVIALISEEVSLKRYPSLPDLTDLDRDANLSTSLSWSLRERSNLHLVASNSCELDEWFDQWKEPSLGYDAEAPVIPERAVTSPEDCAREMQRVNIIETHTDTDDEQQSSELSWCDSEDGEFRSDHKEVRSLTPTFVRPPPNSPQHDMSYDRKTVSTMVSLFETKSILAASAVQEDEDVRKSSNSALKETLENSAVLVSIGAASCTCGVRGDGGDEDVDGDTKGNGGVHSVCGANEGDAVYSRICDTECVRDGDVGTVGYGIKSTKKQREEQQKTNLSSNFQPNKDLHTVSMLEAINLDKGLRNTTLFTDGDRPDVYNANRFHTDEPLEIDTDERKLRQDYNTDAMVDALPSPPNSSPRELSESDVQNGPRPSTSHGVYSKYGVVHQVAASSLAVDDTSNTCDSKYEEKNVFLPEIDVRETDFLIPGQHWEVATEKSACGYDRTDTKCWTADGGVVNDASAARAENFQSRITVYDFIRETTDILDERSVFKPGVPSGVRGVDSVPFNSPAFYIHSAMETSDQQLPDDVRRDETFSSLYTMTCQKGKSQQLPAAPILANTSKDGGPVRTCTAADGRKKRGTITWAVNDDIIEPGSPRGEYSSDSYSESENSRGRENEEGEEGEEEFERGEDYSSDNDRCNNCLPTQTIAKEVSMPEMNGIIVCPRPSLAPVPKWRRPRTRHVESRTNHISLLPHRKYVDLRPSPLSVPFGSYYDACRNAFARSATPPANKRELLYFDEVTKTIDKTSRVLDNVSQKIESGISGITRMTSFIDRSQTFLSRCDEMIRRSCETLDRSKLISAKAQAQVDCMGHFLAGRRKRRASHPQ